MPSSMTGFAATDRATENLRLTWELRSVNHRFLDLGMRLPESARSLEPQCRKAVSEKLSRGKVDCTLKVERSEEARVARAIDQHRLESLKALQREVQLEFTDAQAMSVADVLGWPGILVEPSENWADLEAPILGCLDEAIDALCEARAREGARIADFIEQRNAAIVAGIAQIAPKLADAERRYREKLLERIGKLEIDAQPDRLEQELALIAQRMDISEEVDRLGGHVEEIRDVLSRDEPVGRRLDFLIQELNREANTLSSKSQDEELTRVAVDMKVLIEQIREQVQNLE